MHSTGWVMGPSSPSWGGEGEVRVGEHRGRGGALGVTVEAGVGGSVPEKSGVSMQLAPGADFHAPSEIKSAMDLAGHDETPDLDELVAGLKRRPPRKVSTEPSDGHDKPSDNFSEVVHPHGSNPLMDDVWDYLPGHIQNAISRVPVDFRQSFDSDLYTALKNIAGMSLAPMGKLFTSRNLWARATRSNAVNPFRRESFPLTMAGPDQIWDYIREGTLFGPDGEMLVNPYAPRYLRVDQSKTEDCTGLACVHRAGWADRTGIREPLIRVDFIIQIRPPPKPDKIGFHKIRNFILTLRDLGMKIGGVSFDQYQSEDHMQILQLAGVKTSYLSVDRTDKAYVSTVNLLNEGRLELYPYEPLRKEFFHLDWDRAKGKVDHPDVNSDGSKGSKDLADALVGAIWDCVNGVDTGVPDRREILDEVRTVGPTVDGQRPTGKAFNWLLPKEYRGRVEIDVVKVGMEGGGYDPRDNE